MRNTRIIYSIVLISSILFGDLTAQSQSANDTKPSVAPSIKTFALQKDIVGAASNSVNLFSGDIAFPLNLLSLPGHNNLDVSVSVNYTSNIRNQVDGWNLENPSGILGLGWSLDIPKIVCDNKQTGAREDDDYYLLEGGSSIQLIRTISGNDADGAYYVYETKNYQFWKIKFYYDPSEIGYSTSGSNKWVITKEDGTKYIYGDKNSNRSTVQWVVGWGNWMGNSAQSYGQSRYASIWNLSEVINTWNEHVYFEYDNTEQFTGSYSGLKHTEASYIKSITDVWGRKVLFQYNDKQKPYYMEPHVEQAEPDAYQEVYEKKYLDHIDVMSETSSKLLTIQFGYGTINAGTNAAKLLLTSITQKNTAGNSLPPMKFTYNLSGTTKGCLNSVSYPSGGKISYTYTEKTLGHSDRQFMASAPSGYAEPKIWLSDDYAVVTWRQLGTGGTHDSNPRDVKLYVYQWVGEWKEQFLQTISGIRLEGDASGWNKDYKQFQVVLQKNFFAVLSRPSESYDNYQLFIRYKDANNRGQWNSQNVTVDYGSGVPTLLSGDNFIAVGSSQDGGTHPSHLYTYYGDGFRDYVLSQTTGTHYYTSSDNYFVSHNRSGVGGNPEINFNYLTEDRKWITKGWDSYLEFTSNDPSYWYSSNSLVQVMADDNPEYVYRWNPTYTNFYRDVTDKNNSLLFGQLSDQSLVSIINNSMVGVYQNTSGRVVRFDGRYWISTTLSTINGGASAFGTYFAYGDDFIVRPTAYVSSTSNYKGARTVFNPNTLSWESDVIIDGSADKGSALTSTGIDYYYFGNGYYYRQPDGTWVKKITYSNYNDIWSKSGWPRFEVINNISTKPIQEIRYFKNGEISAPLYLSGRILYLNFYKFKTNGVGSLTIASYSSGFSNPEDATSLYLNRLVDDQISGSQKDYPVTLITINDGITDRYITLDYNTATATIDPGGTTAQYYDVTEIPGSNTASSKPYGYTKNYFFNGLSSSELGASYFEVNLLWGGLPFRREVYDKDNNLKTSETTIYQTFSRNIYNDASSKVQVGYYVRPVQVNSIADNVETDASNYYDQNTGLITQSVISNFDSKNSTAKIYYKYFWEQYDGTRSLNILSPVIQIKKSVFVGSNEIFTESSATTWKTWNNIYGPHKTYFWKRSGSPDFDFNTWSNTGEPSADWFKKSEINTVTGNGNVQQVTDY